MKKNIIKIIKDIIKNLNFPEVDILIQKPKYEKDADVATNVAFQLSKKISQNPMSVANQLKDEFEKNIFFSKVEVAKPGFINFKINLKILLNEINRIIDKKNTYGQNNSGKGKKVLVEFVSANPTGPLTVGHGRGAVLGDVISNIYTWNGYDVDKEYYYNNAGRQLRKLSESVHARYLELYNNKTTFPEDGYKGEYIKDIAKSISKKYSDSLLDVSNLDKIKDISEKEIFNNIEKTLDQIGINFDNFYNEQSLYENKKIYEVINKLDEKGLIYKKDNATWFEGTKVNRDSDRVLIKNTGEPTYRLPDMAYHITKFERGYDYCVDIFGADHMDAYPDVLEVIKQLGYDSKRVRVLIHQFISILQDGKPVKMSTRQANFTTLDELIADVGIDAVRYFFIMRSMNSHLNFDLKLAKEKSEKNPVYYIQYAYARICNILNKSNIKEIDFNTINLNLLDSDIENTLINKLVDFGDLIERLLDTHEPQNLSNYLHELSTLFHKYYANNRIISDNVELSKARLVLIKAARIILRNGLKILGISSPNKM